MAGELDGDVAAADDDDALGQIVQEKCVVRIDDKIAAGELGHRGPATGGDQDSLGRDGLAVDSDSMGVHEFGARVEDLGPLHPRATGGRHR